MKVVLAKNTSSRRLMENSENSDILLEDSEDEIKESEETVKKKNETKQAERSSDSSEDSILKFRNEQEMKKKKEAIPIRVLETPSKTRVSFELNGMKVTLRKRPFHKRKVTAWFVYYHKEEKVQLRGRRHIQTPKMRRSTTLLLCWFITLLHFLIFNRCDTLQ